MSDHASRLAVLQEIAHGTMAALDRIEHQSDSINRNARSNFRWLVGVYLAGTAAVLGSQVALWADLGKIDGHLAQIGSQINHIEQMLSAGKP